MGPQILMHNWGLGLSVHAERDYASHPKYSCINWGLGFRVHAERNYAWHPKYSRIIRV